MSPYVQPTHGCCPTCGRCRCCGGNPFQSFQPLVTSGVAPSIDMDAMLMAAAQTVTK
jgi:hypothetical protein